MDKQQRIEEIIKAMTSCSKDVYYKNEIELELATLERAIINQTYNGEHARKMKLNIEDVVNHLRLKDEEAGGLVTEALVEFEIECKEFETMIKREMAGNRGETKAFRSLETMKTDSVILHNIELCKEENRGEIDAVVITKKAIFLIEVKNCKSNVVIDFKGNYKSGYRDRYYNIGEKMNNKEYLLRDILSKKVADTGKEIRIKNLVVFANSQIDVKNEYEYFESCYLSQLPHVIDECCEGVLYSDSDIEKIASCIQEAECKRAYPIDFDFEKFKLDFATILVTLESELEQKVSETERNNKLISIRSRIFSPINKRYMGIALISAGATLLSIAGTQRLERNRGV